MSLARAGRPRGFTLIELLVVVAIVSAVMGILLPALVASRQSSKRLACGAQLRELGRGLILYAQTHDDVMVPGRPASLPGDNLYWVGNGYKFRPRWHASLGAAVDIHAFNTPNPANVHQKMDNPLLICPEVRDWVSERNSSYGYNFQFLGNARKKLNADRFINFPTNFSRIHPDTIFAADSLGTAAHFPRSERQPNDPNGGTNVRANGYHAFMLDPPRLTADSDTCDNDNPAYRGAPDERHRGMSSFVYVDGHVEFAKAESLGYAIEPDGRFRWGDARSHNSRFSGTGRDDDPPRKVD